MALTGKRILIIIGGGIAAYKVLDLIRRLRERGASLRIVMTAAAKEFVTPLSVASLAGGKVFDDLFSLTDEAELGHIQLSRDADLLVVAPATADLLAKMAQGLANDLASTLLLATDKKILVAPAMNLRMWLHPATQRNMAVLHQDGVLVVGPDEGDMACGEYGPGRMSEPPAILAAIEAALQGETTIPLPPRSSRQEKDRPLAGRRVVVTSGPTHEPLDPVRYIANRSSGKQGHALAEAAAAAGAEVVLISGPVTLPDPAGIATKHVETAAEMAAAVEAALPADIFIAAAAVADWRAVEAASDKIKKSADAMPVLRLVENPDILATVAQHSEKRPRLVVGFAAETTDVLAHAQAKLARKGCDVIVANDVSAAANVMGGDENQVTIVTKAGVEALPRLHKYAVAERLVARFAAMFKAMLKDGSDA
ncbi:MAG: bifunctional phosphopantothenoylcysteine decarboxylase/phosphopantothenate--cysteine ligase CoaBC [Methylovirgula sp.]